MLTYCGTVQPIFNPNNSRAVTTPIDGSQIAAVSWFEPKTNDKVFYRATSTTVAITELDWVNDSNWEGPFGIPTVSSKTVYNAAYSAIVSSDGGGDANVTLFVRPGNSLQETTWFSSTNTWGASTSITFS